MGGRLLRFNTRPTIIIPTIAIVMVFILLPSPTSYIQLAYGQDALGFEEKINGFWEWLFNYFIAVNEQSGDTPDSIVDRTLALENSKDFIQDGNSLYFTGHETSTSIFNSESPIPLDAGVVALTGIIIMVMVGIFLAREHGKHVAIAIGILGIVAVLLLIFNINFSI